MTDLLSKFVSNFNDLGIEANLSEMEFPKTMGARYIFIGHEWKNETTKFSFPTRRIISKSICLITENPGSYWFNESLNLIGIFHNFLFFNKNAYDAFPVAANQKHLFQLFNNPVLNSFPDFETWNSRRYDFNFTGGVDSHRKKVLASYASNFASSKSIIICPDTALAPTPSLQHKSAIEFSELLNNSKCLVNIHREETLSLEWQRVLLALERGCVVVTENCTDAENAYDLSLVKNLFSKEEFLDPLTTSTELYEFAKSAYETSGELREFNDLFALRTFLKKAVAWNIRLIPLRVRRPKINLEILENRFKALVRRMLQTYVFSEPEFNFFAWSMSKLMRAQKYAALSNIDLTRRIDWANSSNKDLGDATLVESRNSVSNPKISVLIPIYREGEIIEKTLKSVQNMIIDVEFEVVVCSDAGDQNTINRAADFLRTTSLNYSIYKQHFNVGVGATRNSLLYRCQGEFALILDGDNSIFPAGLQTLYDSLKNDEDSYFSYGILAVTEGDNAVDIMSYMSWDKNLFAKVGNFIDALSLVKVKKVLSIGGYSESLALYGWEDFDLWARVAHHGGYGVFARNFVAKYLRRPGSMISITDIDHHDAYAIMKSRAPSVWEVKH